MNNQSNNLLNSSSIFLIVMIGAVLGLTSLTQFTYLVYENGGAAFFIPYIIAIVLLGVPFLVLEFGAGFKFKSSLSKLLFNIKSDFEYLGWFILFIVFLILSIYICIMGWDLIYVILSLFKGWGANPSNFFNQTLLHSSTSIYSLTYLIVPIGIAVMAIWASIYLISKKGIKKIATFSKILVPLMIVLIVAIFVTVLSLNGSKLGVTLIIKPDWSYLLNYHVWLAAFTQVLFTLLIGQGVASSFSSYLRDDGENKLRLVDNAWITVLVAFIFQIVFALIIFGLLGAMVTANGVTINNLITDSYSLIFILLPTAFNTMGIWGNIIAFAFFLLLFIAGLTTAIAVIEPFASSIVEKFQIPRYKALRYLCLIGLFASFVFATGMGQYLINVVLDFLMKFAIILAILLEVIILGWVYGADRLIETVNDRTGIKVDSSWIFFIKYVSPIVLILLLIFGIYELILAGTSRTLFIDSVVAVIFVIAPLAITLNLIQVNDDFDLDLDLELHTLGSKPKSANFTNDGSFVSPYKDKKAKRNGKNVISNVDLSSKEFDSPSDDPTLDDFNEDSRNKSVFSKVSMFNNSKDSFEDLNDEEIEDYDDFDDYEDIIEEVEEKPKSRFSKLKKSIIPSFGKSKSDDDFDDFEEIDDVITVESNKSRFNKKRDSDYLDGSKDNFKKFDSSKVENGGVKRKAQFADVGNYLDEFEEESKPRLGKKSKSNLSKKSNSSSKFKKSSDFDFDNFDDSHDGGKIDLNKLQEDYAKNEESKNKSKEEELEEYYEDFSDDFFDDDVFGDEGYESLLDDYDEAQVKSKKSESKSKKSKVNLKPGQSGYDYEIKNNNDSSETQPKVKAKAKLRRSRGRPKTITISADAFDEDVDYDFEDKGKDSVFNLDD